MKGVETFSGRKVLITGASGFIGSHLLTRLNETGAEVHAVSRNLEICKKEGPRWWQADLSEISDVRSLLLSIRPEMIFHLAGHAVGARDLALVIPTFRSNLMSTVNILTIASEIGCRRIVLTGSMEEPEAGDPKPIPSSPYAAAKWVCTAYARMFHALYHLPVTVLRIFMVYGPAQRDLKKLLPYVILSVLQGEIPKLSSGTRLIDWVYVEDVMDGLICAAQNDRAEGEIIDIGSGILVSIRTIIEKLVQIVNPRIKPEFGALPDRPFEQIRAADVSRSFSLIGWKPRVSLEEGLNHTVNWYAENVLKIGGSTVAVSSARSQKSE